MEVTRSSSPSIPFEEMMVVLLDFSKGHKLEAKEKKKKIRTNLEKRGIGKELFGWLICVTFTFLYYN